jgi:hypothetical protein
MESFAELGPVSEIVHLIGAQALSEAASPGLGYQVNCSSASPYACNYSLSSFNEGAAVELGGAVLAIQ